MARDYAKVSARFWTGDTGRQLRALGAEAQVAALYLVTCPSSNMEGLYYLPLPVLVHETGLTQEGASKALRSLGEVGFAHYDDAEEVVWVPEMARHQVGEELKPGDKRITGIAKTLSTYRKCRFYRDFVERYRVAFRLAALPEPEAPPKALPGSTGGASKALRSQEQEQEQDQEQKTAAATRASAREGTQLGSEAARASHPPPAEPAVSEPEVQTTQEVPAVAGTAGPAGGPTESGSPTSSPTPAAVGHPAEAATPAPPTRSVLVLDTTELGEGAAELRAKLERRAEWKFLVAAHERRAEVRKALEVMVEALGVDRCEELCWAVLERRKRNGMQPPKALAFFVPMLEEAAKGGDPMPPEQPSPEFDQAQSLYDTEVEARWAPLLARFNPATREAYEADKARLLSAIRAKGLWVSAEKAELREAEGWLFTKYSRRAAGEA